MSVKRTVASTVLPLSAPLPLPAMRRVCAIVLLPSSRAPERGAKVLPMSVHGFRGRIAVWRETPTDARGDTMAKLVNCECGEIVRGEHGTTSSWRTSTST